MKVLNLLIQGFRGVNKANICFNDHTVLIGPTSCGKSTIIDALALVLGSSRFVRPLTEHDFFGSSPEPQDRILIVATLGGFKGNDPDLNQEWFRDGRAVPKWWNSSDKTISPIPSTVTDILCAQIAFAARFDREELSVETIRYFYDDTEMSDPFNDDLVVPVPSRLMKECGFYVLPTLRTADKSVTFGSDLIRRVITRLGGVPSEQILALRSKLRDPEQPLEQDATLQGIVGRINEQLAQILPGKPRFQLRLTAGDSESLLHSIVPHYEFNSPVSLPSGRHGTGLLSLQTLILLLEIGKARVESGQDFILALEEPELHLPPGLQRKLIKSAQTTATQTICTTHSPRVASFYSPTNVVVLDNKQGQLSCNALLSKPLEQEATAPERKLYYENRLQVVEALMYPKVLIPEGRIDFELLRLLSEGTEIAENVVKDKDNEVSSFGAIVGIIPNPNAAAIKQTYEALRAVKSDILVLVDGDKDGDKYIEQLLSCSIPPDVIIQWPPGWTIENVIGWIVEADAKALISINSRLPNHIDKISTANDLVLLMKKDTGRGGLKTNYLMYEDIVAAICSSKTCLSRARHLLHVISCMVLASDLDSGEIVQDSRSTDSCKVLRWQP